MLEAAGDYDAFFRRVQLDDMPTQTAMLLLRIYHCIQTGSYVISIANVGSKLASCLQHLDGGSACYCCTMFGWM